MKKIAIVTLWGDYNYGNRWQNYAVQEILKSRGYDATTLVVYNSFFRNIKNLVCFFFSIFVHGRARQKITFARFSKRNIKYRILYKRDSLIPSRINDEYDYFVVGSDQVWNPKIRVEERQNFFLSFADEKKRICIAPSFGVKTIPIDCYDIYKKGLNGFRLLSSRERDGARIIKEITGKDSVVLIDPTLLLTKDKWLSIEQQTVIPNYKYILVAFLGNCSNDVHECVKWCSEKYGLRIINAFDEKHIFNPAGMLHMLANASIVFTDSFHFSAFSINFNVPFVSCKRNGDEIASTMYSRLQTLLATFGLECRQFEKFNIIKDIKCDFTLSNKVLDAKRTEFNVYLDRCFLSNDRTLT